MDFRDISAGGSVVNCLLIIHILLCGYLLTHSITIHIPKMNLRPEKYFINVVVADKNFEALNILDNIGYAASIEVLSSDFYDSGKLIKKGGFGIMNVKILK